MDTSGEFYLGIQIALTKKFPYPFTLTHFPWLKSYCLTTLAGTPTATEYGGISCLTTELAPMTA
jgi:hypothetical protein